MVVGLALAAVQMGMALPTGFLFGVGYGTGVRVGYEQVYPLLFPKGARSTTSELAATMKGMNTVYDAIGGKDASRMGIAVGITNAGEILNNPDFQVLNQLESNSSGLTSLNLPPSDSAPSLAPVDPSFSSIPQLGSIFFNQPSLTLAEKEFLIGQIQQSTSVPDLLNMRGHFSDPNLIQVIEARIRELRSPTQPTPPIVNTVPTAPIAPFREATTPEQEYNDWRNHLTNIQTYFMTLKTTKDNYDFQLTQGSRRFADIETVYRNLVTELKFKQSQIKEISQDTRNPNPTIQRFVMILRQEIANGVWIIPYSSIWYNR